MRTTSIIAVMVSLLFCCTTEAQECNGTQCRAPVVNTVKAATNIVAGTVNVAANIVAGTVHATHQVLHNTAVATHNTVRHVRNRRIAPVRNFIHRVRCRH